MIFDENQISVIKANPGSLLITAGPGSGKTAVLTQRVIYLKTAYNIPFDKKRFSPHITLIRKASGEMPGTAPESVSMTVNTISLMRSDRGRHGMIYTELGTLEADE